jgi:anaerobic dimethyl sulfoxide reductase subunit B (iron-sulfur subunit)
MARLRVEKDMSRFEFTITICRQCKNPKCLAACPEDAMRLDDRGVVIINDGKCTRCGKCMEACPFDALFYNKTENRYLKCDLCAERNNGPLCVELCPVGALRAIEVKTEKKKVED